MAYRRGGHVSSALGVDPGLLRAFETVAGGYEPYDVEFFSGKRPRPKNPHSLHPHGMALDFNLIDKATGRALPNIGAASSAAPYQAFVNEVYKWALENDPELAKELIWGGYFAGGGWPQDYMHLQRGGAAPQGGSWEKGFTPEVMAKLGLTEAGGIEALDAAMEAAGYTPEQRRNAIASLESSGSYSALGPEADPAGHRGYGRYQVMDYNIGPWAEQYLKMSGVTPEAFLKDPALQDKLFDAVFGDYVKKYGEEGAALAWHGGPGAVKDPSGKDVLGTKTADYAKRYMQALGASGTRVRHPPNPTVGKPETSPYALPVADRGPSKTPGDVLGEAVAAMGKAPQFTQPSLPGQPAAVTAQAENRPAVDPTLAQQRREQLAAAMARLNSGQLWG